MGDHTGAGGGAMPDFSAARSFRPLLDDMIVVQRVAWTKGRPRHVRDDLDLFWHGLSEKLRERGVYLTPKMATLYLDSDSFGRTRETRALVPSAPWRRRAGSCMLLDHAGIVVVGTVRKKRFGVTPEIAWVAVRWEDNERIVDSLVQLGLAFYSAMRKNQPPELPPRLSLEALGLVTNDGGTRIEITGGVRLG